MAGWAFTASITRPVNSLVASAEQRSQLIDIRQSPFFGPPPIETRAVVPRLYPRDIATGDGLFPAKSCGRVVPSRTGDARTLVAAVGADFGLVVVVAAGGEAGAGDIEVVAGVALAVV